nr:hypothetical protein [Tanacetum cinerariifolium]
MNEKQMQSRESKVVSTKALDASLVVTKCSGTKSNERITSSSLGTYITHVVDADIRPVNNQVPSAEVHLTAQHNILANEQQHTDQSEPSYDTYLLEKVDSNTTPDSTNMCHTRGEIDHDAKKDQVKSPLLKNDWDTVFFLLFDEYFNPPPHAVSPVSTAIAAARAVDPSNLPSSTTIESRVTEKQAGNVQTSLTMSSVKLEIQSMVDVPIHQEDPTVQRTPLIDTIISMVTDKIASTPTPPTTQAHV